MENKLLRRLPLLFLLAVDVAMICMELHVLPGIWRRSGTDMLRFYTNDSNILALIVCCLSALLSLWTLLTGKTDRPAWIQLLRHMASSCLIVTFLIAACILTPMNSRGTWLSFRREFTSFMLDGGNLFVHTLCPLVLCFSCILSGEARPRSLPDLLWPLLPTAIYGAAILYNVALRRIAPPYPFFRIHAQPVYMTVLWCALILLGTCLISLGITLTKNACARMLKKRNL